MLTAIAIPFVALGASVFAGVTAQDFDPPTYVDHDSLRPVEDVLGDHGETLLSFGPLLHIAHGCQPYTAVDDDNHISGGLQDTGSTDGGCTDENLGQTYARTMELNNRFGIMYAWYWPKDHPNAGDVAGGHRHDWENCVVWLDSDQPNAAIVGGACSGHGEYKKDTNPPREGNRVKVEYFTEFPTNHELQFTDTVGRKYWMYDWDAMPDITKSALNLGDFGDANCPFNDEHFEDNMNDAFVE